MKKEYIQKIVNYWKKTAEHDYNTMITLFKNKRYDASLFFGHITLEKILKALVAKTTKEHAPRTHNLVLLAKTAKLNLSDKEFILLGEINEFNIEARYPEWRLDFYKRCTKEYSTKYIKQIDRIYKKLCQKLK